MRVDTLKFFPYMVGLLDLGASLVYIQNREYALAITWLCYAVAAVALGTLK